MKHINTYITIFLCLFLLTGCNEEKAKAIKLSSANFTSESQIAIGAVEEILINNLSQPPIPPEKIAQDLEDTRRDFEYNMLNSLISERKIGNTQKQDIKSAISAIKHHYTEFNYIFRSLDRGNILAANKVKKAERHCINLSTQLIILAEHIHNGKIEVKLNADRILLFEEVVTNQKVLDNNLRAKLLKNSATKIVQLFEREQNVKHNAILKLLKAASIGWSTSVLIRDYDQMNINDILNIANEGLTFASQISENNKNITSILDEYKSIESDIRSDEYWSKILDARITIN